MKIKKKVAPRKIVEIQIIVKDKDGFVASVSKGQSNHQAWPFFQLAGEMIFKERYGK